MIGTQLGHYAITAHLGTGGMGEVYQAKDSKLGRNVAIKILPATFKRDADRVARFEREAQILASLNHPNIATIYGLEEFFDNRFLVLELVEGGTLADRLRSGAIPVTEALTLALQVAHALEAAHEKGVVHRDIKPANIKITSEGKVKVLDFGLAKAFRAQEDNGSVSNSTTMTMTRMAATEQGIILGTAGYMSPEQASGEAIDKRADIWSFGVVLFEMLTGRAVFKGKTVSHVLASVLREDPDWNSLPANLHPRIRLLLERCLEKEARNRCHDIADARVDIERVLADPQGVQAHSAASGTSGRRAWSVWSVLVWPMTAALLAGALVWYLRPAPAVGPAPAVRFPLLLPDSTRFAWDGVVVGAIAASPDGTQIAFAANSQLFLWNLSEQQAQPQPVPGTGGHPTMPVFSPDGSALAYVEFETSKGPFFIRRVPVAGGTPVPVFESKTGQEFFTWGLTWPSQETLVFVTSDGVVRIPSNGAGEPEVLVQRAEDEVFESPQILPGGNELLFVRLAGANPGESGVPRWNTAEIVIQSIGSNVRDVVWKGGSHPRYLPTGQVVFAQDNSLFALSLDLDSRKVTAGPVSVLEGIRRSTDGFTDAAQYSISDTGVLVSIPEAVAPAAENGVLALLDRKGVPTPLPVRPAQYRGPRFSPDGTKIAVEIVSSAGQSNIGIYDVSVKSEIRYLPQIGSNTRPIWNPDGKRVTFGSNREGAWNIYEQLVDDNAPPTPLTRAKDRRERYPDNWSPTGKTLVFVEAVTGRDLDLWTLSEGDDQPALLAGQPLNQFGSAFSPDGKWILYTDNTTPFGLLAKPFPLGELQRITQEGEAWPIWSGPEVFYRLRRESDAPPVLRVMEDVKTSGGFSYKNSREFPLPKGTLMNQGYRDYDWTRNGDRFVIILSDKNETPAKAAAAPERINVVLNWPEELRKRLQSP